MAPGILADVPDRSVENGNGVHSKNSYPTPLKPSGALDTFQFEEATPVIGREYPTLNIVDDILNSSNADDLLRDLAITSESSLQQSVAQAQTKKQPSFPTRCCLLPQARQPNR